MLQALNEEKGIAATLKSVQTLDPPAYEIFVVDGGSQDRSEALMCSLSHCTHVCQGVIQLQVDSVLATSRIHSSNKDC